MTLYNSYNVGRPSMWTQNAMQAKDGCWHSYNPHTYLFDTFLTSTQRRLPPSSGRLDLFTRSSIEFYFWRGSVWGLQLWNVYFGYKFWVLRHLQIGGCTVRKYTIIGVQSMYLQYREILVTKRKIHGAKAGDGYLLRRWTHEDHWQLVNIVSYSNKQSTSWTWGFHDSISSNFENLTH